MSLYSFRRLFSPLLTDPEEGGHVGGRSATKDGEHGSGNGFDSGSGGAGNGRAEEDGGGVGNGLAKETAVSNTLDLSQDAHSHGEEGIVQNEQALPPGPGGDKSHG